MHHRRWMRRVFITESNIPKPLFYLLEFPQDKKKRLFIVTVGFFPKLFFIVGH